jgi:ribosomal protein S27AE
MNTIKGQWEKKKEKNIELFLELPQRPPCPECGSTNMQSSGLRWVCKICGRQTLKQKKKRVLLRPDHKQICPRCNSDKINSHGYRWFCIDCKRVWSKI